MNKHKLYVTYRNSKDPNDTQFYKKYCMISYSVITGAKKNALRQINIYIY
jgi:hypothetical protein